MLNEYNIDRLNPRLNPYIVRRKKRFDYIEWQREHFGDLDLDELQETAFEYDDKHRGKEITE